MQFSNNIGVPNCGMIGVWGRDRLLSAPLTSLTDDPETGNVFFFPLLQFFSKQKIFKVSASNTLFQLSFISDTTRLIINARKR